MTTATVREISAMESILAQIVDAAGFRLGEQYTAERVVQALLQQGRAEADAKIAELYSERHKLHAAMMEARHQLMGLSMATEGAERTAICRAANVLARPLGLEQSIHGRLPEPDEDFEAQRRLAEQSAERD